MSWATPAWVRIPVLSHSFFPFFYDSVPIFVLVGHRALVVNLTALGGKPKSNDRT